MDSVTLDHAAPKCINGFEIRYPEGTQMQPSNNGASQTTHSNGVS